MIWLAVILMVFIVSLCWLLLSPLLLEMDTRIPQADLKWAGIGNMKVWYEQEWLLKFSIFFFRKTISLAQLISTPKKIKSQARKRKPARRIKPVNLIKKVINVLKTFMVTEWKIAVDTSDFTRNAQLYPLNFLPGTFQHLYINFNNENYLVLKIRSRPWKILFAFIK